jgi:glycosyltransferase involved in cell wall biosynthesis
VRESIETICETACETISVIVPVHNRQHLIGDALASIVAQGCAPIEIVVVDDGSTDDTAEVVRRFGGGVKYLHQEHAGVAVARNRGLAESVGEWVAFLDSDDIWLEGALSSAARHLRRRPEVGLVHGRTEIVRLPDAAGHRPRFREGDRPEHRPLLGSMLVRRSCFDRVGTFDPRLKRSEDLDWLARATEAGIQAAAIDEVWLRYRVHATNITNDIGATTSSMVETVKRRLDRKRAGSNE